MDLEKLRYPIGKYSPGEIDQNKINDWIEDLRVLPAQLTELVSGLSDDELQYTYRPDGWNIQQLVHHLADSHMNSITRFKWTLTEDNPTIKPYIESEWAKLYDVKAVPIEASLKILEGVHLRLTSLLSSLQEEDFEQTFVHPEYGKKWNLAYLTGMYSWHSRHHLTHIKNALEAKKVGWE